MAKMENKGNVHIERTTVVSKEKGKTVINTVQERDYNGKVNTNRAKAVKQWSKGLSGAGGGFAKSFVGAGVGILSTCFTFLLIVLVIRFLNNQSLPTAEGFFNWISVFSWEGIPYIAFDWQTDVGSSAIGGVFSIIWGLLSKVIDSIIFLFNLLWSVLGSIASLLAWVFFG